jgi:N-acetylglucosamine kinase-like BadF-type ATPase
MLMRLPDTARWYMLRGRRDDARRVLADLDPDTNPDAELAEIAAALSDERGGAVKELLRTPWRRATVFVHDARLVLAAADLDAGIAVIAGTGSAGWGRSPDGREARAGGFGYLLGDEGSGYWTAREAVRHVLHHADTGVGPDPLGAALLDACGVATPVDLFDLFYTRPERAFWAGHAGVVARLAGSDQVAAEILGRAADALGRLATTVGARLDAAGPVVLGGGFAVHEPALRDAVAERLAAAGIGDVRVIPRDPVAGAVRLAIRLSEETP